MGLALSVYSLFVERLNGGLVKWFNGEWLRVKSLRVE